MNEHDDHPRKITESLAPESQSPGTNQDQGKPRRSPKPPAAPFTPGEILAACRRPDQVVDLVLTNWQRLAANVAEKESLGLLVALLLSGSILFALPYGAG